MISTQKDIAEQLGISVSLVSRALSGKAESIGVPQSTIERIRREAERVGYQPNAAACALKGAGGQTVGVLIGDVEDPFFNTVEGELIRCCHRDNFSLALSGLEHRTVNKADVQLLLKHDLRALVIVGSHIDLPMVEELAARGIPVLRFGEGPGGRTVTQVTVNVENGIRALLKHLADFGHRDFGFVGAGVDVHRQRYDYFRQAVKELKLHTEGTWVGMSSAPVMEAGAKACAELFHRAGQHLPTALVASSDIVALGALRALADRGLKVPDDMSVVGFDDIPMACLACPSLTTMRQPVREMAERAMEIVRDGLAVGRSTGEYLFEPLLVKRESSSKPRKHHLK